MRGLKLHLITPCDDPECQECYWKLAGDVKDIFRISEGSWNGFCTYLKNQELLDKVRWIDGNIYLHTSADPGALGEWGDHMHYLIQARKRAQEDPAPGEP